MITEEKLLDIEFDPEDFEPILVKALEAKNRGDESVSVTPDQLASLACFAMEYVNSELDEVEDILH